MVPNKKADQRETHYKDGRRTTLWLFGKSRQAYYDHIRHFSQLGEQEEVVVEMVHQVRRELPGLGGHKLYRCLYTPFRSHSIKIGRDKLYTILGKYNLLIDKKRKSPRTTSPSIGSGATRT